MRAELRRVGKGQSAVVVVDGFSGNSEHIAELASRLAPFPPAPRTNYYPGLRRVIAEDDGEANDYVNRTCAEAAQFIYGAFDIESFSLIEASFSLVTSQPEELAPPQRIPHFDSTNPKYLALLHYLRVPEGTGTAFYRQRSTGIEQVTDSNLQAFVKTARQEVRELPDSAGYIHGSTAHFEQIGSVEGIADRLVIYQGSLLHSGIIPPDMSFSPDPEDGRLTANIFVLGH